MSRRSPNKTVTFVALDCLLNNASVNIPASFYDENGAQRRLILFRDSKTGEDIVYKFKFGRDKRHVSFPEEKVDLYGESYVEFMRNHPLNAGSPNPDPNPWFKELNDEKDATIAVDDFKARHKAEDIALALKGDDFDEVSKVLGIEGAPNVRLHKMLEFASRNPRTFIEAVEDPNRKPTALFKAAVNAKVITKRGFMYVYKDAQLGNDEEKAIKKIAAEPDLQEILSKAIARAGK